MKWESNEYLEINLISPPENLFYESGTQIDIDIKIELVILDKILYKWDGDGIHDEEWSEPYTTNLSVGDGSHTLYVSAAS